MGRKPVFGRDAFKELGVEFSSAQDRLEPVSHASLLQPKVETLYSQTSPRIAGVKRPLGLDRESGGTVAIHRDFHGMRSDYCGTEWLRRMQQFITHPIWRIGKVVMGSNVCYAV